MTEPHRRQEILEALDELDALLHRLRGLAEQLPEPQEAEHE